ncbi:MAG: Na+/H+ antiporter subunit E [Salinibacter sp.]
MIWTAVQGAFTLSNFVVGFVLGYGVLLIMQPLLGEAGYDARLRHQVVLVGVFLVELVLSSLRVAYEAATPGYKMRAGIIAVPLDVQSDLGITLFANLISLTPGTLSLEVDDDRSHLYVHAMYIDDTPEHEAEYLKNTLERRVIRALGAEVAGLSSSAR